MRLQRLLPIEQATVIQRILRHLGLPTETPEARPPRAPPIPLNAPDLLRDNDVTRSRRVTNRDESARGKHAGGVPACGSDTGEAF